MVAADFAKFQTECMTGAIVAAFMNVVQYENVNEPGTLFSSYIGVRMEYLKVQKRLQFLRVFWVRKIEVLARLWEECSNGVKSKELLH